MRIVFVGPPGAGKGTQSQRLLDYLGVPHLSTGEMLRQAKREGTTSGVIAAQFMDQGNLVPDPIVVAIVGERLQRPDAKVGCLFDGFPRTLGQARALDEYLNTVGTPLDLVLELKVAREELERRLNSRGREDDEATTIRRRLVEYAEQTEPILEYYRRQGKLLTVDGLGSADEVAERIRNAIDDKRASAPAT